MSTSWSDTEKYKNACLKAVLDEDFFQNFKRDFNYNQILEHVNKELGQKYLDKILENKNITLLVIEVVCWINDNIGNPEKFLYDKIPKPVSPTSLRYIKVQLDLENLFGRENLEKFRIVEIGGGYGGQCLISNTRIHYSDWQIFDLKEATQLQTKYLNNFVPKHRFKCFDYIFPVKPDLVISNYAFSEINREIQQEYLDKIIKNAVRGYMIFNNTKEHGNITIEECKEIIKGSQIVNIKPDYPCLIWGKPFKKLIGEL